MEISELELKMMAKMASSDFLEKSVPLNDSVVKVAYERRLNPYQVARLCEETNLAAFNDLFKKVGSCDFVYDLADQDKVIEGIKKTAGVSVPDEFNVSPSDLGDLLPNEDAAEKRAELNEKADAFFSKHASKQEVSKKEISNVCTKLAYMVENLASAAFEAAVDNGNTFSKIESFLKSAALRGENIGKAYFAAISRCRSEDEKTYLRNEFSKIGKNLRQHGIDLKKHATVFTESLTDGDVKSTPSNDASAPAGKDLVVNSNHSYVKHIDTVLENHRALCEVEKKRDYLVKKIRFLEGKAKDVRAG